MVTASPLTLVLGPAGIGKTTVVRRLTDAARPRALVATCDDRERDLPYGVVRQLFESLSVEDGGLPEQAFSGAAAPSRVVLGATLASRNLDRTTVQHALTWLVENLATALDGDGPLTLVVDDLQWADAASLSWLLHVARRLEDHPIRLVFAWRTDETDVDVDVLERLRDHPGVREVWPAALSTDEVAVLVRRRLGGATSDEVCAACATATGGNPFLVHELLRTLAGNDLPTVDDIRRASSDGVARSVGRRLSKLSPTASLVADCGAVLGDGATLHLLATLANVDVDATAVAVDELVAAGVMAPGNPISFLHPLVRQATYTRIGQHRRGTLHRAAAKALDDLGAEIAEVGNQLMSAPPLGERWAAERLLAAGRRALQSGAVLESKQLLERALGEEADSTLRPEMLLELGQAEFLLLEPTAESRLNEVARDPSVDVVVRARAVAVLAAFATMNGNQPDPDLVAGVRADLGELDEGHRELALMLDANVLAAGGLGPRRNLVLPETEALAGRTPGERLALAALAYHHVLTGEVDGVHLADIATRAFADGVLVEEANDSSAVWQAALVLIVTHQDETFRRVLARGLDRARVQSSELGLLTWSVLACYHGWWIGDLREAESHGQTAHQTAERSEFWLPRAAVACYLSRVLVERGHFEEADQILGGVMDPNRRESSVHQTAAFSLMLLRSAQQRWADVIEIAADLQASGPVTNVGIVWRLEAAIAAARSGDLATARQLLEEHRCLADTWALPRQWAAWQRANALVQEGADRIDGLRRAADSFARTPSRLELARTLVDLGVAMRAHGQRADARTVLTEALDAADRCGADRLVAIARDELVAVGVRPRRPRSSGVHALTASELRVARLAADGLSNPEIAQALFVTRKTVEAQLSAVYRKLGVEGRTVLPEALTTQTD